MSIAIDIRHRLGATFELAASFESQGRLTALFGRSGAGKTSLVNIIGGLVRPDRGCIVIDGETLVDTRKRIFVPPHRRRVGYVFQEGRLFPHLTVRQNLRYGRWFTARRNRYGSFEQVVDLLGIGPLLERRPTLLSGGEKQRVAIGRALLASPRLLLMDEPLAALDEARKAEIVPYIERLRDETDIPIVYISHSIAEVARLATAVVVLSDGKIVAAGATRDVMSRTDLFPATGRAEAGALLVGKVARHDDAFQLTTLRCRAGDLTVPRLDLDVGAPVRVRVRARDVMLALTSPEGLSALNILPARVRTITHSDGPIAEVGLDCSGDALTARLTRWSVERLALAPGRPVFAIIKSIAFDSRTLSEAPRSSPARDLGGIDAPAPQPEPVAAVR